MKTLKSVMFDFFGGRDIKGKFTSGMNFDDGELRTWETSPKKIFEEFLIEIVKLVCNSRLEANIFNEAIPDGNLFYMPVSNIQHQISVFIPTNLNYIQIKHFNDKTGLIIYWDKKYIENILK